MRIWKTAILGFVISAPIPIVPTHVIAQSQSAEPSFDVVSIKPADGGSFFRFTEGPDGSFNATGYTVGALIARAYPPAIPIDLIGLPSWASTDRYDVRTTSVHSHATPDQRIAMLRAMLSDRFKLVVHVEQREQPAFDLVLARSDGRFGPGMKRSDVDCAALAASGGAAADRAKPVNPPSEPAAPFARTGPIAPCIVRTSGPRLEGDITMATLASLLRGAAGRYVEDKSGLVGTFSVSLEFNRLAGNGGRDTLDATADGPPSVFTAVQEQLGLKLVPSRAKRDVLVIDRLEKPTEK